MIGDISHFSADKLSNLEFILSISSISFFSLILSFWFAFHFTSFHFVFFSFVDEMQLKDINETHLLMLWKHCCDCVENALVVILASPSYLFIFAFKTHAVYVFSSLLCDWIIFFFQFDQKVYCCSSHRFHWMYSHLDWFGFL